MNDVEPLGFLFGEIDHFHGRDLQPGLLKAIDDISDNVFLYAVGFDDRESFFHGIPPGSLVQPDVVKDIGSALRSTWMGEQPLDSK